MKSPLEITEELVELGLGEIQKVYTGGFEFDTWFIYTGRSPIHICDQILETGDMFDLTYWSYDE